MTYLKELSCFILLMAVSLHAQTDLDGGNRIEVQSVTGRVNTRRGCEEAIICQGVGIRIDWTKVPGRTFLNSTNTRNITSEVKNGGVLSSTLSFSPITERDDGTYTCFITDEDGTQLAQSIGLNVDANPLEITPIANIDISTFTINDVLPIACRVDTCATDIRILLVKDDNVIHEDTLLSSPEVSAYHFEVAVNVDTPGMYACRVETGSLLSAMHLFNITGTPIIPPEVTTLLPGVTKSPTDPDASDQTTTDDDDDSSVPLHFNVVLLSILLLLSLTLLLA